MAGSLLGVLQYNYNAKNTPCKIYELSNTFKPSEEDLPDERTKLSLLSDGELTGLVGPDSLDYIVTNPPFGIRMARETNFLPLYQRFIGQAVAALRPGGMLTVLVGKRRAAFNKVLQETSELTLRQVRVINLGGVYPGIFVLQRL